MCRWRFPCGFAASATKILWSEVWLVAPSCNLHVIIQLIRADLSLEVTPVKEVYKKLFNARSLFPTAILLSGLVENPGISYSKDSHKYHMLCGKGRNEIVRMLIKTGDMAGCSRGSPPSLLKAKWGIC